MPEMVRVKDKTTGHEFSWPAHLVKGVEGVEVLDKPAVGDDGEVLPAKNKTTVEKSAAGKNSASQSPKGESGQKAASTKENS